MTPGSVPGLVTAGTHRDQEGYRSRTHSGQDGYRDGTHSGHIRYPCCPQRHQRGHRISHLAPPPVALYATYLKERMNHERS